MDSGGKKFPERAHELNFLESPEVALRRAGFGSCPHALWLKTEKARGELLLHAGVVQRQVFVAGMWRGVP